MNQDVVNAMLLEDKEEFMKEALKEAKTSYKKNETPIGAIVVYNNEIHILGSNRSLKNHYKYNGSSWVEVSTLPYDFTSGCAVVYNNENKIVQSISELKSGDTVRIRLADGSAHVSVTKTEND